MSIVADALNRLQSSHKEADPAMRPGQIPGMDSPSLSLRTGRWLRPVVTWALVIGLGVGSYWWGLSFLPALTGLSDPSRPGGQPPRELAAAIELQPEPDAQVPVEKNSAPLSSASELANSTDANANAAPEASEAEVAPSGDTRLPLPAEDSRTAKAATTSPDLTNRSKARVKPPTTQDSGPSRHERTRMARMFIGKRLYAKAGDVLRPVFVTPPRTWEPWYLMGTAQLALGHLDEAEQYLEEGLTRDGTIPQLWVQRALLAQQRGRPEQALEALDQAARLKPELPAIQLNMGYLFELQGNIPRATQHYRRFLTLTEGKPAYHGIRKKILSRVIHHAPSSSRLSAYNR